mmetsp:Transcript_36439/g.66757  ORF Transcript_36439/g.66757 Transcript_36439/m.66757 type:complete len:485 (-) Transcript_36439:32-1486(-)
MPGVAGGILPGAHLRTTFSGLSIDGPPPQKHAGSLMRWAPQLATKSDAQATRVLPAAPEHTVVQLISHVGRRGLTRSNIEQEEAAAKAGKAEPNAEEGLDDEMLTPDEEEHLIYMALYRDKIDQHQAELERGGEPSCRSSSRQDPGRGGRSAIQQRSADISDMEPSICSADNNRIVPSSPRTKPSPRGRAGQGRSILDGAPAHSASVSSRPHGGIVAEFDESKRLGRLFDEYFRTKASNDEDVDAPGGRQAAFPHDAPREVARHLLQQREPGRPTTGHSQEGPAAEEPLTECDLSMPLVPVDSHAEVDKLMQSIHRVLDESKEGMEVPLVMPSRRLHNPMTKSPSKEANQSGSNAQPDSSSASVAEALPCASSQPSAKHTRCPAPQQPHGSAVEAPDKAVDSARNLTAAQQAAKSLDRRLVERVYKSITDRRVNLKATGDRVLTGDHSGRKEPMTIEAFPTIHLTRMYRGRLDLKEPPRKGTPS